MGTSDEKNCVLKYSNATGLHLENIDIRAPRMGGIYGDRISDATFKNIRIDMRDTDRSSDIGKDVASGTISGAIVALGSKILGS